MNLNSNSKIFVFNNENTEMKDFSITLEPQAKTYHRETNKEPLIIEKVTDVHSISITLG